MELSSVLCDEQDEKRTQTHAHTGPPGWQSVHLPMQEARADPGPGSARMPQGGQAREPHRRGPRPATRRCRAREEPDSPQLEKHSPTAAKAQHRRSEGGVITKNKHVDVLN